MADVRQPDSAELRFRRAGQLRSRMVRAAIFDVEAHAKAFLEAVRVIRQEVRECPVDDPIFSWTLQLRGAGPIELRTVRRFAADYDPQRPLPVRTDLNLLRLEESFEVWCLSESAALVERLAGAFQAGCRGEEAR